MMMDSYGILLALAGILQSIAYIALLFVLFRKAGLRGGVMAVCMLPAFAVVGGALISGFGMSILGDHALMTMLFANSLLTAVCNLAPLLVLAVLKWPRRDSGEPKDLFA